MRRKLDMDKIAKGLGGMLMPALTDAPCDTCLDLAKRGRLRPETIGRLPPGAMAPLSRFKRGVQLCYDCAAAEAITRVPPLKHEEAVLMLGGTVPSTCTTFEMARIAVANDRQEQYRLPGVSMGLVMAGWVRPSKPGDLEDQHAWLDRHNWFGLNPEHDPDGT